MSFITQKIATRGDVQQNIQLDDTTTTHARLSSGTIFYRIRNAKQQTDGNAEFLMIFPSLIIGTTAVCSLWFWIILLIFLTVAAFATITIGSLYVYECPAQPFIPVYLIVGGVFLLIVVSNGFLKNYLVGLLPLVIFFLFIWYILGCLWTYTIYEPNYTDRQYSYYCNKVLYNFALWWNNFIFLLLALHFMFICCLLCFGCCVATAASV